MKVYVAYLATDGGRDAVALGPSPLFEPGERVTGHEFHRTTITALDGSKPSSSPPRRIACVFRPPSRHGR